MCLFSFIGSFLVVTVYTHVAVGGGEIKSSLDNKGRKKQISEQKISGNVNN